MTALVLGGLALAAGWGLWVIRPVLAPFLLAVALAYLVAPLVNALAARGLGRGWAILAIYILLGLGAVLAVVKLLPQAISETRKLAEAIPAYSGRARELVDGMQSRIREMGLHPGIRDMLDRSITDMEAWSLRTLGLLLDIRTLRSAAALLASVILAPFLAFYLLKDIDRFKERFVQSLPRRHRQDILSLLRGLDAVLSGFIRGQILLSFAVGSLAVAATALLGIRYAVLLGIWAGMTEFIPYVGPVLGAIPAVLAGLSYSPVRALETAVAFAIIQQLENAVLSPKIMGDSVGLHPLVVLLSVFAGSFLIGPWGLVLALPAAGILRVFWYFLIARLTDIPREVVPAFRPEPRESMAAMRPEPGPKKPDRR